MSIPPWVRTSTEPAPHEVERITSPADPALMAAVRQATAPTADELARLRLSLPRPERSRSPLWLGAPVALAIAVLAVRWMVPTGISVALPSESASYVVRADAPCEIAHGVWVSGRGTAEVHEGRVHLEGILRVDVSEPTEIDVEGVSFSVEDAEFHVAGGAVAVVRGSLRRADGSFLVAGDRFDPRTTVVASQTAVPERQIPAQLESRMVAVTEAPEAAAQVAPVAEAADDAVTDAQPEPAPVVSEAVAAWRVVLDARDSGVSGARLVRQLETYHSRFPTSPFAEEAADLLVLERAQTEPAARAVTLLEERLAAGTSARPLELHASAAFLAREALRDCGRAEVHDQYVAQRGSVRQRSTARAFLGLCALREGRIDDARAVLATVDDAALDLEVAAAVARARIDVQGGEP